MELGGLGHAELPFASTAIMRSAGIYLHESRLHTHALRALATRRGEHRLIPPFKAGGLE
jgi:hypothetical protein